MSFYLAEMLASESFKVLVFVLFLIEICTSAAL